MDWDSIKRGFNRALSLTFDFKKLAIAFSILVLCGVLIVFFRGLASHAGHWVVMSLTFLPIFLCGGLLLSAGILLIRLYHHQVKNKAVHVRETLYKSWEILLGASYFAIPLILCYLLLWMVLGIFVLLQEVPGLGNFFGVILAFAPFLLNFASLLLCVVVLGMLFFVAPVVALKGLNGAAMTQSLRQRLSQDPFSNFLLILMASLPLLIVVGMLLLASLLTGTIVDTTHDSLGRVMVWFFIMIPFTALLSPAVVFFFNFAAEAHVLMRKNAKEAS